MTVSTHVYSAHLIGSPDVELSFKGGSIVLDAGAAPHVQGDIRIAFPDEETLVALDPRENARIRVGVEATFPDGVQTREFDLGLRTRPVAHRPGEVTLSLASDEALLLDFAPLEDDRTPETLEASLRDVIDYVLDTVIPGAALEATPSVDADVTRFWEVTNRVHGPSAESTSPFVSGTNAGAVGGGSTSPYHGTAYIRWAASAAGNTFVGCKGDGQVQEGDVLTGVAHFRCDTSGRTAHVRIRWYNDNLEQLSETIGSSVSVPTGTGWVEATVTGTAPRGAVKATLMLVGNAGAGGQIFAADGLMLYDGDEVLPFFTGSSGMPGATGYTYAWSGDTSNSASTRTPYPIERDQESLTWAAGQSAYDFLDPLIQAAGLRLVCDESRAWTLRPASFVSSAPALNIRRGVNMIDATDTLSREGDSAWFDAAVTEYVWRDRRGIERRRLDSFALNDPYTRCVKFDKDTPYPGDGFSEYAVSRAQGRGRVVEATRVALWDSTAEQGCQFIVTGAPTQTGKTDRVSFDFDRDEMTVTARTTDTPDEAWVLIPAEESWLDSPVGESWTEEVIP